MVKKLIRLIVQVLVLFFFVVGFVNLIWWNIGENDRIETQKAQEHLNMLNDNRASLGVK